MPKVKRPAEIAPNEVYLCVIWLKCVSHRSQRFTEKHYSLLLTTTSSGSE
jgi:hypothetical protein